MVSNLNKRTFRDFIKSRIYEQIRYLKSGDFGDAFVKRNLETKCGFNF